jgi:hypothetical protein
MDWSKDNHQAMAALGLVIQTSSLLAIFCLCQVVIHVMRACCPATMTSNNMDILLPTYKLDRVIVE